MASGIRAEEIGHAMADFAATHPLVALMALWLVVILILDPRLWHIIGKALILGFLAYFPFWLALEGERLAASLTAVGAGLIGWSIYFPRFWRNIWQKRDSIWRNLVRLLKWLGILALVLFVVSLATASPLTAAVIAVLVAALWFLWNWTKIDTQKKVEKMIDEVSGLETESDWQKRDNIN